jgi:hypothetical protein
MQSRRRGPPMPSRSPQARSSTIDFVPDVDDVLSPVDAGAIHAYLIDLAWQLKQASAGPSP